MKPSVRVFLCSPDTSGRNKNVSRTRLVFIKVLDTLLLPKAIAFGIKSTRTDVY